MSGGVDSSVAAAMLVERGYDVIGVTMQIWQEAAKETRGAGCCSLGAVEDARRVAATIGIPHYCLNYRDYFAEQVIDRFVDDYRNGRTPNPCVNCNRFVKFDALLEKATALGASFLATGHYARVRFDESAGTWRLLRAVSAKDQTYALYHFTQGQLGRTMMPLGDLADKGVTRQIARELGLGTAEKPDSQEICFVQDGSYTRFLAERAPETLQTGDIVDSSGKSRGRHDGIAFYTIGQRKRINVGSPVPLYVIGIDAGANRIVVGDEDELMADGLVADDVHWIAGVPPTSPDIQVKVRYNMSASPAVVVDATSGRLVIKFCEPLRAVTPGQAAVVYNGDEVLGGATIQRALTREEVAEHV
jgi:tRNA-specific 2-thiouridylase